MRLIGHVFRVAIVHAWHGIYDDGDRFCLPSVNVFWPATLRFGRFFDRWCSWLLCEGDFVMNGARVAALNEQIYQLQKQTMEGLINEQPLTQEATRRGISAAELLEADRSFCHVDRGRVAQRR